MTQRILKPSRAADLNLLRKNDLQLVKVLLYDKMVRKILVSLIFFMLLGFFFALAKQNTALADCTSLGGTCMSGGCSSGYTQAPGSDSTTCNPNGLYVCCARGTASTVNAVPLGQYGCSFKNDTASTPVIPCQTGGKCLSIPPY